MTARPYLAPYTPCQLCLGTGFVPPEDGATVQCPCGAGEIPF